jgi:hypothetical protein
MSSALAYVNWGRWVAECPADGCHDARELVAGQASVRCALGHTSPVKWPGGAQAVTAITNALNKRPDDKNRNWFPGGHPVAAALNAPTDQTPADLDAETEKHATIEAAQRSKQAQLRKLLDELGLVVQPDGSIAGNIDGGIEGKV